MPPNEYMIMNKLAFNNNYRRLHGLRVVRHKTWKHKPKSISLIVRSIGSKLKFLEEDYELS